MSVSNLRYPQGNSHGNFERTHLMAGNLVQGGSYTFISPLPKEDGPFSDILEFFFSQEGQRGLEFLELHSSGLALYSIPAEIINYYPASDVLGVAPGKWDSSYVQLKTPRSPGFSQLANRLSLLSQLGETQDAVFPENLVSIRGRIKIVPKR